MRFFSLSKAQRIVIFAAAAGIVVMQLITFEEQGVDGYGWVLSFLATAALVVIGLSGRPTSVAGTPLSAKEKADAVAEVGVKAKSMALLTAELTTELEKHWRERALKLAVALPGFSLTAEAALAIYTVAVITYLEAKSGRATTEFMVFKALVSKALGGFIAHSLDTVASDMARATGAQPGAMLGVSSQLTKQTAAFVESRLQAQYKVAQECLNRMSAATEFPLGPLYRSIPVGNGGDDRVLEERFGAALRGALSAIRDSRSS